MPGERRERMLAAGEAYALLDSFIYASHALLKTYDLNTPSGTVKMGHYLLDFTTIYRLDCNLIVRGQDAPAGAKYLQLTVAVREQLRQKLASYFARVPDEDLAELGG